MTVALVICAGEGKRWDNHLGAPKHFAPVDGEPILARTVRLFDWADVKIVAPGDSRYCFDGTELVVPQLRPNLGGYDKFWSSEHLWSATGRTIILYGDVYFTDEAADTIRSDSRREWLLFARPHGSALTGRPFGECFAQSFYPEHHDEARRALTAASEQFGDGGGWEQYLVLCGADRHCFPLPQDRMVVIDDWTDDFDWPIDYQRFLEARG